MLSCNFYLSAAASLIYNQFCLQPLSQRGSQFDLQSALSATCLIAAVSLTCNFYLSEAARLSCNFYLSAAASSICYLYLSTAANEAYLSRFVSGVHFEGFCEGLGTGTDNRTGIFTLYFTPEPIFCTGIPEYTMLQCFALSLSSYINGHSQKFDFYTRFRGFLVALPRVYWQER